MRDCKCAQVSTWHPRVHTTETVLYNSMQSAGAPENSQRFFFPELERKPRQDKTSTKDTRRQGRLNPKEPQSIQSRQSDTFTRKPHIDPKDKAKRPTVHIQLTVVGAIHQKLCFVLRIENSNFSWLSSDYREV